MKATVEAPGVPRNDVAILADGRVVDAIQRYHDAMSQLTGRQGVRNDYTRYEAVAIALTAPSGDTVGQVLGSFPPAGSRLLFKGFFELLYRTYDHRFVYAAPDLRRVTRRLEWDPSSPGLASARGFNLEPRLASEPETESAG